MTPDARLRLCCWDLACAVVAAKSAGSSTLSESQIFSAGYRLLAFFNCEIIFSY